MMFMKIFLYLHLKFLKHIYPSVPTISLQSSEKKGLREGKKENFPDIPLQTSVYNSLGRTLQITTLPTGKPYRAGKSS